MEGDETSTNVFTFQDSLDAGEARLLQMIGSSSISNGDLRITDPDLSVILPADSDTLTDLRGSPGESVNICAMFYNMGMSSLSNVRGLSLR